jgi:hypothetical protein
VVRVNDWVGVKIDSASSEESAWLTEVALEGVGIPLLSRQDVRFDVPDLLTVGFRGPFVLGATLEAGRRLQEEGLTVQGSWSS